jgi:hypothetical protein
MTPAGMRVLRYWTVALSRRGEGREGQGSQGPGDGGGDEDGGDGVAGVRHGRVPGSGEVAGQEGSGEQGERGQEQLAGEEEPGSQGAEHGQDRGGHIAPQVSDGVEGEQVNRAVSGKSRPVTLSGMRSRAARRTVELPAQYRCRKNCSHRMRRLDPLRACSPVASAYASSHIA